MSLNESKKTKSEFAAAVEKAVNAIPRGKVVSYGQIAVLVGMPRAAQAVGQTLHFLGESTPWHKVINRTGRLLTKCSYHTMVEQRQKLAAEDIDVFEEDGLFRVSMKKYQWVNSDQDLQRFMVKSRAQLNKLMPFDLS